MNSLRQSQDRLKRVVPILLGVAAALPRAEALEDYLIDAEKAQARGYFLPDEDEKLREVYSSYLALRASLHECIQLVCGKSTTARSPNTFEEFLVAFAAATQLMRTARYLIDVTVDRPVVRKKLDEAELRYGLGAKSYTHIYKSMTSPRRWLTYMESVEVYFSREEEVLALLDDPLMAPVVRVIQEEKPYIQASHKDFVKRRLRYRLHSWKRRHRSGYRKAMFHLFRLSGSAIAEMRYPAFGLNLKKSEEGKRVTDDVRRRAVDILEPGDVVVTRHDDALSNLFLPGFWPHAALYVGTADQRRELGVDPYPGGQEGPSFVEAKKDGVRFRSLEETLCVDAFTILRPCLDLAVRARAIQNALSHVGKLYDFVFDFRQADRLACTGVIYRSYHGLGGVDFILEEQAGRLALTAEVMMRQMLASGKFESTAVFGLNGCVIETGGKSAAILEESLSPNFRLNRKGLG